MADRATAIAWEWGTTEAERARTFACDGLLADADDALFRGITVDAPAPVVFRWLCQLRVAPYSYDWLDNVGRQSPRARDRALAQLAIGHRFMRFFTLVAFEPDRHVTLRLVRSGRTFGELAVTYEIVPAGDASRLLAKLRVRYPRSALGWLMGHLLPWGDLVMMRKQLLTLKTLAEREVSHSR